MKLYGGNKIFMLETAQTLRSTSMPKPYSFVHGRGEKKIILQRSILPLMSCGWPCSPCSSLGLVHWRYGPHILGLALSWTLERSVGYELLHRYQQCLLFSRVFDDPLVSLWFPKPSQYGHAHLQLSTFRPRRMSLPILLCHFLTYRAGV